MHMLQNFYTTWARGVACQKQRLGPKLEGEGGWARGASKKFGTPYLFLQPLKLATSNLVHNLGLGLAYQKTTFRTKIGRRLGQGNIQQNLGPLHIFATVEASNFKLVHKLGFGLAYQKRRLGPKLAGVWARGASRKIWDPLRISATVEASNFKFGIQLGFGTILPKNNV